MKFRKISVLMLAGCGSSSETKESETQESRTQTAGNQASEPQTVQSQSPAEGTLEVAVDFADVNRKGRHLICIKICGRPLDRTGDIDSIDAII